MPQVAPSAKRNTARQFPKGVGRKVFTTKWLYSIAQGREAHPGYTTVEQLKPQRGFINGLTTQVIEFLEYWFRLSANVILVRRRELIYPSWGSGVIERLITQGALRDSEVKYNPIRGKRSNAQINS